MDQRERIATAVLAALVSREDLALVFISKGKGIPLPNGYAIGPHGERHESAEHVAADLAVKFADELIRRLQK